jgi:hypothetical protein|tara:strand:+ start:2493 stop:2762 length:270 start_codon:yes stop_codon:yes gene_type:complete
MITDPQLRDDALEDFIRQAPAKFNKGMAEHNPDGTRGLMRMSPLQLIESMEEEVIDQWHYCAALRRHLIDHKSTTPKPNTPKPLTVSDS